MNDEPIPVGRMLTGILAILGICLLMALAGLVALGIAGGDPNVRDTLTHLIETLIGIMIGVAAGRLVTRE